MLTKFVEKRWYGKPGILLALLPLEYLFRSIAKQRIKQRGSRVSSGELPGCSENNVPVIVVGNLSVGGTGKTPFIIALIRAFTHLGYRPGVISKGYGRRSTQTMIVNDQSTPDDAGDEPVLIYKETSAPVVVGSDRNTSALTLLSKTDCNLIFTDDGLQDYSFRRDIELVVVDANRAFGNRHLLPVGPLREPLERLHSVDLVVLNGNEQSVAQVKQLASIRQLDGERVQQVSIKPLYLTNLKTREKLPLEQLSQLSNIAAVAGLGNPEKFFRTLAALGATFQKKIFPDHYRFQPADFDSLKNNTVVMTTKDAVKCASFATESFWELNVAMHVPESVVSWLNNKITALPTNQLLSESASESSLE